MYKIEESLQLSRELQIIAEEAKLQGDPENASRMQLRSQFAIQNAEIIFTNSHVGEIN